MSRMKLQVWGALSSLGSALPCGSFGSHKLPWVTGQCGRCRSGAGTGQGLPRSPTSDLEPSAVSHHDPEIPFNHSFIEPPSAGWASDDSFSSDPESGEDESPAYCMPPQEGSPPVARSSQAALPTTISLFIQQMCIKCTFQCRLNSQLWDMRRNKTDFCPRQAWCLVGGHQACVGWSDIGFDGEHTNQGSSFSHVRGG